ncbi:MAG: tripartite tricarboxylate transporter permease, partial [Rhodospirillaceae bacterium]|nr:tripartite tricarboxylate transporter permease [Rhodospirillaceae bacterium]
VLIGLFGLAAILEQAELGIPKGQSMKDIKVGGKSTFSFSVFKGQIVNLIRSSGIGTFVGILPGVGGSAASILSYSNAKTFSRNPEKFGKGEPAGIIASEAGNNGLTGGALVPLLSLGIPGDATTALLVGAFTLQGIQVGPLFIGNNVETWNAMIIAMLIANVVMFGLMYWAIRYFALVVTVPKHILFPIILMMCVIGAYTINYGIMFDVWTLLIFGVGGWLASKLRLEVAPFIIGFILGPSAEVYFVKSLESFGDLTIFFTKSWIAVLLWVLIAASVFGSILMSRAGKSKGTN